MNIIELLGVGDANSIISLSRSVGWDYTLGEVQVFLSAGTCYGHRRDSGRIVSCAGLFAYGGLASIGAVIVHPELQGQGLGRALMQRILDGVECVPTMLVSTVEGAKLYASLGFQTVSHIHKLVSKLPIQWSNESIEDRRLSSLSETQLDDVIRLDEQVVGANRSELLRSRYPALQNGVVLRDDDGMLRGYAMTVCRNNLLIVGPVVASNHASALAMIRHQTKGWQGVVRVDVPSAQVDLVNSLIALGMQEEERPPIMLRNAHTLPGDRNHLYAIAAQAFG